ncbi:non-homologous end joining protein Ku [Pararhizobium haloflavum]|uniref:non-homologous end joining protein Ku n=1 Tax=Pararhizobium haloflavum TaxID=2037914 RepID=UPI000C17A4F5|nr:Ku protein [Pararhizobium haloflavum]
MAARAMWKGQLRLSLVSIPVELYSATRTGARVSFRQIHEPTGKPIRYEKVVEGHGPVDADEIVKGFEYEKGNYVLLDPDEIEAVKLETRKTLELVQFVGACEIPPLYYDKPYYVVPTDELAEDAYRVVRDALRNAEKVGLGQLAMRGHEYLCAIRPCGDGLLLETLHYADEIRKADPLFSEISGKAADEELLEVATALIDRKTAKFDPKTFKDHYADALRDLIDAKTKNKKSKRVESDADERKPRGGDNVVDLMSALKKSLETSDGKRKTTSSTRGKSAAKGTAGRSKAAPRKKSA